MWNSVHPGVKFAGLYHNMVAAKATSIDSNQAVITVKIDEGDVADFYLNNDAYHKNFPKNTKENPQPDHPVRYKSYEDLPKRLKQLYQASLRHITPDE
jgi:hypothetical protein